MSGIWYLGEISYRKSASAAALLNSSKKIEPLNIDEVHHYSKEKTRELGIGILDDVLIEEDPTYHIFSWTLDGLPGNSSAGRTANLEIRPAGEPG